MFRKVVLGMAAACTLAGCAGVWSSGAHGPAMESPVPSIADAVMREGYGHLRANRPAPAAAAFNRAIARAPEKSGLHLLAGIAYHLDYLQGNQSAAELAEVAYGVALQLDGTNVPAMLQTARLMADLRQYERAQAAYAHVLDAERDNAEAAYGLAQSSYYLRDLETALLAIWRSQTLQPAEPRVLRAAALIRAAAGDNDNALLSRARWSAAGAAPEQLAELDKRLDQWRDLHADPLLRLARASTADNGNTVIAQAPGHQVTVPGRSAGTRSEPLSKNWMECATPPPNSGGTSVSYPTGVQPTGDETTPLQALPSPCNDRPLPRMALIDASILRSEESASTSAGINLLQGLQVVLGFSNIAARVINNSSTTPSITTTVTRNRSVGLPQAGITYALNIANAVDLRADVLSRPSLVALDRQPSTFFSGTNLTIAVPGQLSGGNIVDKPIGLSLSVTPTFIDDENILLAIRAARSDVEQGTPGSFDQALHTTRNMVTSNVIMRFDQTLILSGLTLHESVASTSGAPGLREIPGVQYLFSSSATNTFRKSVLISLTLRRPVTAGAGTQRSADPILNDLRERLAHSYKIPPNLQSILKSLSGNRYVMQFRNGDLQVENWRASLDRLLTPALRWLHY